MFPCSISGPLKASAATSLHKVTAFQVQKHKCYTLPSPVLCTDTYQSQRTSSQFHQQLKMVRETKGERCIPPPPPYVFPLTVSYTAVSFHYLGHQLASRRLKKTSSFVLHLTYISPAFCSESECLLGSSCQFLGEGFEKQALVIRSNAVTDCWVFIPARLKSSRSQIQCVPPAFVITQSPVPGCDCTLKVNIIPQWPSLGWVNS